jgi:hypothetical protein
MGIRDEYIQLTSPRGKLIHQSPQTNRDWLGDGLCEVHWQLYRMLNILDISRCLRGGQGYLLSDHVHLQGLSPGAEM